MHVELFWHAVHGSSGASRMRSERINLVQHASLRHRHGVT